ncbi:MAG: InlB B-repeat-containing protein [Mediterraneibacter gnavus]
MRRWEAFAVEPQQDTYEAGTEIKVSAVPASEDYEFVGFTKKGTQEIVSKENPYVFQIQENMELTANFKEVEHSYLIYVESPDPQMGTVTMDPANEGNIYKEGTEITVKAEPKDGYEFTQWLEVTEADGEEVLTPVEGAQSRIQISCRSQTVYCVPSLDWLRFRKHTTVLWYSPMMRTWEGFPWIKRMAHTKRVRQHL